MKVLVATYPKNEQLSSIILYDDLKLVKTIPADKMNALKAIFGSMYIADLETHAMFV